MISDYERRHAINVSNERVLQSSLRVAKEARARSQEECLRALTQNAMSMTLRDENSFLQKLLDDANAELERMRAQIITFHLPTNVLYQSVKNAVQREIQGLREYSLAQSTYIRLTRM